MSNASPYLSLSHLVDEEFADSELGCQNSRVLSSVTGASGLFGREFGCPPASRVLGSRHGFEMVGSDAIGDSAEMVDLESIGDNPDLLLVHSSSHAKLASINADERVGATALSCLSDPARRVVATVLDCVVRSTDRESSAVRYVTHRVASLVEEARKGLEKMRFSSPSYYLDTIEEGRV
jgi:hypothetical protein